MDRASQFKFRRSKSTGTALKKEKRFLHPDSVFISDCVTYNGKFLGEVEVPGARGVELINNATMKLKFAQSLNVSESGKKKSKLRKVELKISVDSMKVLDMKTKESLVQRPLHRVSYCADDATDTKLFAFIAKEQETNVHKCFAFVMEHEACAVTLAVGQAFDVAFKRFCKHGRKEMKETKEILDVSKHVELVKRSTPALGNGTNGTPSPAVEDRTAPLQTTKWTTFDENDSAAADNATDAFENYLFDLNSRSTPRMQSYDQFDQSSDGSSGTAPDMGTLFVGNMFSENGHPSPEYIDEDAPTAIAKPPSKKDIRCGKKISWDGLSH